MTETPKIPDSIQWDGTIQSAQQVCAFVGQPFKHIWGYVTLVDGKPTNDVLYGGPALELKTREGDIWLQPGDWIVKGDGDFKLVRGTFQAV